ncbi:hypothetical protein NDU88_009964 [Pleurodeles waltl]|uniref:Uncharacterized protein n=1 Tax=Pleurodeles waltl TaxID=8319 RepID=A0AAV7QX93_PLEWA|nr:hypothetical protein NDU88_009964 [Pleurodeles waltl]
MARNRKAALQTGGRSPAPQEALDHMEEIVAAVIPEEIVTGIQGQDSADYQETTHMQDMNNEQEPRSQCENNRKPGMSHYKALNTDTLIVPYLIAEDDGSPADMPVQDYPDDMDDELTNISQQTLQDILGTLQTPPSVTRRSTELAAITEDPPTTPIVRPASSNTAEDTDNPGTGFERTLVGVQRELAKEVWVGMQTMAASLEGVRLCMM